MTHLEQPALPSCEPRHDPPKYDILILLERILTLEAQNRMQAETLRLAQLDIEQRVEYAKHDAHARQNLINTNRALEAEVQRLQTILAAVNAGLTAQRHDSSDMRNLVNFWAEGDKS